MRAEAAPLVDFAADFRSIRQAKHAPRRRWLASLERFVLERVALFQVSMPHLETIPRRRWSKIGKEVLRHCYDVEGQNLTRMKTGFLEGLSDAAKARCPYCMLREPRSIDHFLPVDVFPEYAVLVLNWVYACERCNLEKGVRLTQAPRELLNPYFDAISATVPLVYARVTIIGGAPSVAFDLPDPNPLLLDPALVSIARRQFVHFNLKSRYEAAAATNLDATVGTIVYEASGPLTADDLRDRLQARRANLEDLGINGWERRLCEAMEVCADLLGHVNDRIANRPPKPLLPAPHNLDIVMLARMIADVEG